MLCSDPSSLRDTGPVCSLFYCQCLASKRRHALNTCRIHHNDDNDSSQLLIEDHLCARLSSEYFRRVSSFKAPPPRSFTRRGKQVYTPAIVYTESEAGKRSAQGSSSGGGRSRWESGSHRFAAQGPGLGTAIAGILGSPRAPPPRPTRGPRASARTSVVSDSVRPHRRRPTRLPCPCGLRGNAGGGARVTAGPKRPHLSVAGWHH